MDFFLDMVWEKIEAFLTAAVMFIDRFFSPLEAMGPGFVILIIAFLIVSLTRVITRFYETKRHIKLKTEFEHWQAVREEALKHPDKEKGKRLARNIDQGKLNKAYYDYFFEGLLKNFITTVLPILLGASYVTSVYTPRTLLERFGKEWVFTFSTGSDSIQVSSFLWYVVCLLVSFILVAIFKKSYQHYAAKKTV